MSARILGGGIIFGGLLSGSLLIRLDWIGPAQMSKCLLDKHGFGEFIIGAFGSKRSSSSQRVNNAGAELQRK